MKAGLLSGADGEAFVVALDEIRVLAGPRVNLQLGVGHEQERLAGAVERLAHADLARRHRAEHLFINQRSGAMIHCWNFFKKVLTLPCVSSMTSKMGLSMPDIFLYSELRLKPCCDVLNTSVHGYPVCLKQ